ncbi:MAG: NUDIX domain-containing protein [Asgard group archaeon]|nr:NUDIX domain-containing protein [Asgard group archaeon]
MSKTKATFIVAVTAIIENLDGNILLIKRNPRSEYPNCWEDVGGRLKQSELPEEGLLREIKEETGLVDIEIIKPLTTFHVYRNNVKTSDNELIGIAYWSRTKSHKISLSSEHTNFQWVKPEEALEITDHPALKEYLHIFLAEKQNLERTIYVETLQ